MNYDSPQLLEQLASAWALGTLRGRARARFERLCQTLPAAQAARQRWEDRLLPLALSLEPVPVRSQGWSSILHRIEPATDDHAHTPHVTAAPAAGWRWLAAACIVAITLLFAQIVVRGQPEWQPVATLAQANAVPLWQVERTADSGRIRLRALRDAVAPNGGSYELWVIPAAGGNPVSLGILPAHGEQARLLDSRQRELLRTAKNIAVSLEPGGGSRNGLPTQVLFAAGVT